MSLEKCCKSNILVSASLGPKLRIPIYQARFFVVLSRNLVLMPITTMCCWKIGAKGKPQVNQFWQFVFPSTMTFLYNNDGLKESPYYFHHKVISVPKRRDHRDLFSRDTPTTQHYYYRFRIQLHLPSPRTLLYIGYSIPIDLLLSKTKPKGGMLS